MEETELRLRTMLLPVLGLQHTDEVQPQHSLVADLGADSLDFVEIVHLVEKHFGVALELRELTRVPGDWKMEELFRDGRLTAAGKEALEGRFPGGADRLKEGMTKVDIFSLLTISDLARLIESKLDPELK